ncbi:SDR family oxidoreductase [Streptomyces sp. NBC_01456]|uniref:SDR family oxidoreductase n=1 Tax=unclassified Streptomyces TaxID=2593676 RepID=UPI002E2F9F22|nr:MULTISPECIES: SDR family oxidoreductase [unclassified Streptomyces]
MPGKVVVTGASSGIGAATVRRLTKDGFDVVAVARRADRLAALAAETGAQAHPLDITDDDAVRQFAAGLDSCDVLVNNAGGALGAEQVALAAPDDWAHMFSVNVLGTLRMTQALLPLLRAGGGTVVTITSTAAFTNYEGGGGYSAAKHAEHALSETLRLELCGAPVRVIEVAPGMVHTEEFALNRLRGDAAGAAALYENVDAPLSADDVAQCVSLVVGLPQHVNVDRMVVRPLAQAAQHKLHRGPLLGT